MNDLLMIWDGLQYRRLPRVDAERLVAEDKAQRCDRLIAGHELKRRGEFTGYASQDTQDKCISAPPMTKRSRRRHG